MCSGELVDKTCDWDSPLPEDQIELSETNHAKADLVLCLVCISLQISSGVAFLSFLFLISSPHCLYQGTSLRIRPAGNFPLKALKRKKQPRTFSLNPPISCLLFIALCLLFSSWQNRHCELAKDPPG
jgi:hypothetical protein